MRGFAHVWHWLTDPPPTIIEPEQRRQTHLLLSVLMIIWLMWALYLLIMPLQLLVAPDATPAHSAATALLYFHLAAAAPMALAYLLGRRGHYYTSARILVPTASSIAFIEIMFSGDIRLINLPTAAIVLCSIFLSTWETVAAYGITVVGYLVLAAIGHLATAWNPVDPIIRRYSSRGRRPGCRSAART